MATTVTYDKKRFAERSFSTSDAHVPPGGLGCFHASFDPVSGAMPVVVRICPRFVSPSGQPVGVDVQKRFTDAFEQKVPEYWNNRFRFVCTKRGFEGVTATPAFEVRQSPIATAHYDLKIVDSASGNICVRTGEDPGLASLRDPKWDPFRGKLSAQFQMTAIQADQLTKAGQMLTAIEQPVELAVQTTPGQPMFSLAAMERLRAHARDVEYVVQLGKKKPKLTITGPGPTGSEIAKNVGKVMRTFGYGGEFSFEKNGRAGHVKIELSRKQAADARALVLGNVAQFPSLAQYAVVHEFGHMLGLPDEYMCYGSNTVSLLATHGMAAASAEEQAAIEGNMVGKNQPLTDGISRTQAELVKLCALFGVPAPPFGRANPSIMSTGHYFMPCHGVTVAHALWRMTRHYFAPSDWRIELLRA